MGPTSDRLETIYLHTGRHQPLQVVQSTFLPQLVLLLLVLAYSHLVLALTASQPHTVGRDRLACHTTYLLAPPFLPTTADYESRMEDCPVFHACLDVRGIALTSLSIVRGRASLLPCV